VRGVEDAEDEEVSSRDKQFNKRVQKRKDKSVLFKKSERETERERERKREREKERERERERERESVCV
jgi:hypothetical protein